MFFRSLKVPSCYYLIDSPRKLSWMSEALLDSSEYAFDIETNYPTGNTPPPNFKEVISGISFAWGRKSVTDPWSPGKSAYIPLRKHDDSPFWGSRQDSVMGAVKGLLESDIPKVAQYGKFDTYKLCKLEGIKVKRFDFDVCLAHSLLDEERLVSSHALKSEINQAGKVTKLGMADVYLKDESSLPKQDLEAALNHYDPKYRRYSKVPLDILYPYGCSDSDYTLSLKFVFEPLLREENMLGLFQIITMNLQHELMLMELHGVPLDLVRATEVRDEQFRIMQESAEQSYNLCAAEFKGTRLQGTKFDIGSPTQVGRLLFEEMKIPGGKKNNFGNWITDVDALSKIDHPIAECIAKYRRAQKIYSSYAVAALDKVEEVTNEGRVGWVHTTYFPDSKTGRLRGADPNLMQLPRPENGGDIVKSMWAGGADYRFIFKDYSQIELKFVAHCSQEPIWVEGFKQGHDMHAAMAQRIWHPDMEVSEVKKLYPQDRSSAKAVNFGIIYGRTVKAQADALNISYEAADHLINVEYFGAAPVLKAWVDAMHDFATREGYVRSIFHRRRHLPDAQIAIPEHVTEPYRSERPGCYKDGPFFSTLGLDPGTDLALINDTVLLDLIRTKARDFHSDCSACAYVRSCITNTEVRRMTSRRNRALRQAVNSPIQGGASDMVSLALVWIGQELRRHDLDASLVLNIHDELGVYSHIGCVEQVDRIMDDCMCTRMQKFTSFSVPLTVDTAVVHRWSEKHDKE